MRIVGGQDRSEIELDPVKAYRRARSAGRDRGGIDFPIVFVRPARRMVSYQRQATGHIIFLQPLRAQKVAGKTVSGSWDVSARLIDSAMRTGMRIEEFSKKPRSAFVTS
jgi:hypothetical protein